MITAPEKFMVYITNNNNNCKILFHITIIIIYYDTCTLYVPYAASSQFDPFTTLESNLQKLEEIHLSAEVLDVPQKDIVMKFLRESQQSRKSAKDVKEFLHKLHQKYLIRKPVYEWAIEEVKKEFTEDNPLLLPSPDQSSTDDSSAEPLFSKDTVYHASICCQALASCNQRFFKDREKVLKHSFEAVSISHPSPGQQHERYLIAKQGKSKYYIAFESQPDLSQWQKKHQSFVEGD